jgi:predicted PurR-regulated permease PerM
MNSGQKQGMVIIAFGFILTVIAGVTLAFLANEILDTLALTISAVIAFLLLAPIFGFGIYRYANSTQEAINVLADEMEKPRQLLDILKAKGQTDIESLSRELDTSPSEIKTMIDDLSDLELFSGIINWDKGIIAIIDSSILNLMETCKNCTKPITMEEHSVTVCAHCGTEYHQI